MMCLNVGIADAWSGDSGNLFFMATPQHLTCKILQVILDNYWSKDISSHGVIYFLPRSSCPRCPRCFTWLTKSTAAAAVLWCFLQGEKPSQDDIKTRMLQICMRKVSLLRILVNYHDILLMAEIPNNHLGCMKPYKQWDKLPTSTGDRRIWAINSDSWLMTTSVCCQAEDPTCRWRWPTGKAWEQQWLGCQGGLVHNGSCPWEGAADSPTQGIWSIGSLNNKR